MTPKLKVFYIYLTPRKPLYEAYKKGEEPSTFLYGLVELKKLGFKVDFSDIAYSKFNFLRYALQHMEILHKWLINYPLGFRLHQALLLWPLYRNHDVILTTQDSAGLPIAFLKRIGLIKNRVIYMSSNLTNALLHPRSPVVLQFTKANLQSVDMLICSSKKEQELLETFLERKVIFLADGIDIDFFRPSQSSTPIDILAVGKDVYRDYVTLFKAVEQTTWNVTIVCNPENIRNMYIPNNVHVLHNVNSLSLKILYAQSKVVVLPLKKTDKPQGHTALLSAMSMHKRIIASNVVGITTSYDLKRYPSIQLVPPENPHELKLALSKILQQKNNLVIERTLLKSFSIETYAKNLGKLLREVMN